MKNWDSRLFLKLAPIVLIMFIKTRTVMQEATGQTTIHGDILYYYYRLGVQPKSPNL